MRPSQPAPREVRFTANRADAFHMSRIAESIRDRLGSPFLDWGTALRMSLAITCRVIEAGELDRFRSVPVTLPGLDTLTD